jgi:hypothetical protein
MKRLIIIFLLPLIIVSCSENKEDDVVDIHDVIPEQEEKPETDGQESSDSLLALIDISMAEEAGISIDQLGAFDKPMFPDRFGAVRNRKLVLNPGKDSLLFCQWVFRDSVLTKNALYNWLDCFGAPCKSIKINEKKNFQRDHLLLFMNDTSITYLSSPSEIEMDKWVTFFEKKEKKQQWRMVIKQKAGGKAAWSSMSEGKEKELVWRR